MSSTTDTSPIPFNARLKAARTSLQVSQATAAKLLNIAVNTYSRWENDKTTPDTKTQAKALAKLSLPSATPEPAPLPNDTPAPIDSSFSDQDPGLEDAVDASMLKAAADVTDSLLGLDFGINRSVDKFTPVLAPDPHALTELDRRDPAHLRFSPA